MGWRVFVRMTRVEAATDALEDVTGFFLGFARDGLARARQSIVRGERIQGFFVASLLSDCLDCQEG
jgi:hypothetical protein